MSHADGLLRRWLIAAFVKADERGLVPRRLIPQNLRLRLDAKQIFGGKQLVFDPRGYWRVDPMPSGAELTRYYEAAYWAQRGGKTMGVRERDLDHFELLSSELGSFLDARRTVVNFGAGHGGISYLLYHQGHEVINVEPSGLAFGYEGTSWQTFENLSAVRQPVDLLYGSHSLEHVRDLSEVEEFIASWLSPGGYVFWEVPNGNFAGNGGANGRLQPPHTYYFTVEYFAQMGLDVVLNSTFREGPRGQVVGDRGGQVIRFLGRRRLAGERQA